MSQPPSWHRYIKEFTKIMEGFRYSHGIRELFADWVEIAACAIHQEPYHLGLVGLDDAFRAVEDQYLAAAKKYSREELDAFAKLLGITKLALGEARGDFLGAVYMGLEISQDRSGEFFTPFPVSLMMAKVTLGDVAQQLQEKKFITVAEPACGSGGMLIAVAQTLEEAGFDPGNAMFFEATDISKLCCDMAYLQTAILGLSGIVRHGDTLRATIWSSRFTPVCRVFPARTNAFLARIYATPEAGTSPNAEPPPPANDNKPDQAASKATDEVTTTTNALHNLSDLDEGYVQGRLF